MSEMTMQEMEKALALRDSAGCCQLLDYEADAIAARLKALGGAVDEALKALANGKGLPLGEDTGLNRETRAIAIKETPYQPFSIRYGR